MKRIHPTTTRDADVFQLVRADEDTAHMLMDNGKIHEVSVDAIVEDWLQLHIERQRLRRDLRTAHSVIADQAGLIRTPNGST